MSRASEMADELKREGAMTRRLLERMPDDRMAWSPAEGLHSVAWNAAHLADIAGWTKGILEQDGMDLANEAPTDEARASAGSAAVLAWFDGNLAASVAALEQTTDETLQQPWTMKMGGQELFTMKKVEVLSKWVVTHTAHHRGILSTYLKLAGVEFSSIYEE